MRTREHSYTSTACVHDLHDQCRQSCKFCDQRCQCECHDWNLVTLPDGRRATFTEADQWAKLH